MKDLSKFFASQSSKHLTHEELKFIIGGGDDLSTTSLETSASGKGCDRKKSVYFSCDTFPLIL